MTHTRISIGWTDHRPGPDLLLEGALSDYLRGAGFELVSCRVGSDLEVVCAESLQQLQSHPWGQMAARAAQARQRPLMVMLNHATSSERAALLEQGADDCMTGTTIVYRELAARLHALWRRHRARNDLPATASPMASEWIKFGAWQLDTRRHHLIDRAFQEVPLTRPEYRLLLTFLSMPSQVFTHEQLLDAARARGLEAVDRSLDALVARLAQKLGDDPERPTFIQPVRGQGYVFNAVPPLQLC